ncbi:MAG: 5'/3'-nucleotidase SurE [Anaerolineaceae bacterium]|nr:5'/3'-nucleotidase SurE [Anaerolineaceae bacterium]
MNQKTILVSNDDGIASPGLWAAAEALTEIANVVVVAPREQHSGSGRSFPIASDLIIEPYHLPAGSRVRAAYQVGGSPAQVVFHGLLEVLPELPDLVVSGINYGENLGTVVSSSGTVGAALEAASDGVRAIAVSLQVDPEFFYGHSDHIDFSVAAHFTRYFAEVMFNNHLPEDIDVLKVDVPAHATLETGWKMTRISRCRYYQVAIQRPNGLAQRPDVKVVVDLSKGNIAEGDDIHTLLTRQLVSVTPVSIDMTSRVDLAALEEKIKTNRG